MSKTNRHDADVGSANSYNDGRLDGNGAFDVEGGDVDDDGDEQTQCVAGDLAKCNGSSKMEMKVGVIQMMYFKGDTEVSAQKRAI